MLSDEVMWLTKVTYQALDWLATLFVFFVGFIFLVSILLFIVDVTQKKDAVRRNYPVIGRFRHLFSQLGEFFRQYFFAMDREKATRIMLQIHTLGKAICGVYIRDIAETKANQVNQYSQENAKHLKDSGRWGWGVHSAAAAVARVAMLLPYSRASTLFDRKR